MAILSSLSSWELGALLGNLSSSHPPRHLGPLVLGEQGSEGRTKTVLKCSQERSSFETRAFRLLCIVGGVKVW